MIENKKKLLAVVGPTASGKSALAVDLARELGGEVVCCDSMQVYRSMVIGTAAPTPEERAAVKHRLFGYRDPRAAFSCSDFVSSAARQINRITARGALPVFCGGTGLYLDALLFGVGGNEAKPDPEYRAYLEALADREGALSLHGMLTELDPEAARAIHPNNVRRVIRALEICRECGSKTEHDRRVREKGAKYDACIIGLRYADRALLVERIDRRVDKMLEAGLIDETRRLEDEGVFAANQTAAQAIGYKEILPYIHGECTLDAAVERLKIATRQYAKRQMTWFSAKPYVNWLECDGIEDEKTYKKILKNALEVFHKA